jgi:lactate racemase
MNRRGEQEFSLAYGAEERTVRLPRGRFAGSLEPKTAMPSVSSEDLLRESLAHPIGSRPLHEIARGKKTAAILIPGKARRAAAKEYVPALVAELNRAGLADEDITAYLADGTHEQHLETDLVELLGRKMTSRIRCRGHDCHDEEALCQVGTTRSGTPVWINREVLHADVRVLTGRIVPHYFAGWSGGRKALIPGVAGFRTIVANHRLMLGPERGIHPDVRPCSLAANPVHQDMLEGARMVGPEFCLNTILDADHRMVAAVAGDLVAAHEQGCRLAEEMLRIRVAEPVDLIITSAGGLPHDVNFMQALKAVFNVLQIVRPGGAILWLAECAGGMHPGFLRWGKVKMDRELDAAVRADYDLTGHNSIMLRQLERKADVGLVSALPPDKLTGLGLRPLASVEEGISWILERFPGDFTYVVVPHASVMCANLAMS